MSVDEKKAGKALKKTERARVSVNRGGIGRKFREIGWTWSRVE